MWILRYVILASRNRGNALLDTRTRMTFDPMHGCPMHVCQDKAEWDRRGRKQVAQLESELRQDIEAYNTVTHERRVIAGEMIEVRPVVLEKQPEALEAFKEFLGETKGPAEKEKILPEAVPEMEAAPVPTGDALVSSGVEAQAEAEPGADPTFLEEGGRGDNQTIGQGDGESQNQNPAPDQNQSQLQTGAPSTEVPEAAVPTEAPKPKSKTKPAGKAGRK